MNNSDLIDACDRYLSDLHTVLWGRAFGVHKPAERLEAARWLAEQIEAVRAVQAS